MKFVLITGMSGAGKTVALKMLEDCGFEAIDNLPLAFLPAVAASQARSRNMAVACDIRSRDFTASHFLGVVDELRRHPSLSLTTLFLDCDDEVLRRRFTETRRRHPLAEDRTVVDGIALERELLKGIIGRTDLIIDSSDYEPAELRETIASHIAAEERKLTLALTSFSFKQGLPRDADMVVDVRFLKNPHYVAELKELTGKDKAVGEYIEKDADFADFFRRLTDLVTPLLPRYRQEGKNYFTLAIGCTGGKHRSVYITEKLAQLLQGQGQEVTVRHRDIPQP